MKHTKCYIPDYPHPQLVRSDWVNLNGEWKFAFGEDVSEDTALQGELSGIIQVPFTYETKLSGIEEHGQHPVVWYSRQIKGKEGKRAILYFDGADYDTEVYVGGKLVGTHRGAYSRFSFDVTDYLTGEETLLVVKCTDHDLPTQVRGKQRWEKESYGCWYVQTTGIYKSVWMEYVDEVHLTKLKITPDIKDYTVTFDTSVSKPADDVEVRFDITYEGRHIQTVSVWAGDIDNTVTVRLDSKSITHQVELWSLWNPALYDVEITVRKKDMVTDSVGSYFGLREYAVKNGKLLFNSIPFYAKLLLDQGYWPESGITPPSEEALIKDIELSKQMGFIGVRKHQKIEDERFFYYADIMGFMVWCELPSNHWFSDESSKNLTMEWLDIVMQNYNHPSLVTWVIFNENWGVRNIFSNPAQGNLATGLYYLTKSIDTMRPVISNDGWVHTKSDILTLHHYEQDGNSLLGMYDTLRKLTEGDADNPQFLPYAEGYSYEGQPIIFTEFGGTAYVRDEDHGWGYGAGVNNEEEFLERFGSLIDAIKRMNISGYCYTQITDVEQEVNGLLTTTREPKVAIEEIAKRV